MQPGEHDPSVSNRPDQPELVERINAEIHKHGSALEYVHTLILQLTELPEHRANILQLQRLARTIVTPNGIHTAESNAVHAFYWGEVLGYSTCLTLYGDEWIAKHWRRLNSVQQEYFEQASEMFEDPLDSTAEHMSQDIHDELELSDDILPTALDEMAENIALQISSDPDIYGHIVLGFRHQLLAATQPLKGISELENEANQTPLHQEVSELLFQNGYLPLEQNPHFEAAHVLREEISNLFGEILVELEIGERPIDDIDYQRQLNQLTEAINKRIADHPTLSLGEEYRFGNKVIATTYSFDNPNAMTPLFLDDGSVIEGSLGPVYVMDGPSRVMIEQLNGTQEFDGSDPDSLITPYCLYLEVTNAIIQEPGEEGVVHTIPDDKDLFIIIENEALEIARFVVQ